MVLVPKLQLGTKTSFVTVSASAPNSSVPPRSNWTVPEPRAPLSRISRTRVAESPVTLSRPIEVPPLRERVEDIPVLVNDLILRIEHEKRGSVRLTPAAVTALTHYRWPGNVRELANLIERLAILFPYGVVDIGDLPEKFRAGIPVSQVEVAGDEEVLPVVSTHGDQPNTVSSMPRLPAEGIDLKLHLANMEQSLIRQALEEANGVVAHAAKKLKMRRTTLVEKLRKYGLQRGQELTGL